MAQRLRQSTNCAVIRIGLRRSQAMSGRSAASFRHSSTLFPPPGGRIGSPASAVTFCADGRIEIPILASGKQPTDLVFVSPAAYVDMSDAATRKEGFFDHPLAMQVQQFGVMAHVSVSYESRTSQNDPKPFVRGVKSFELLNSGGRWYITQVAWDRERQDNQMPEIYLHDSP